MTGAKMRTAGETIRGQFVQRIAATPPGVCAVEQTQSILKVCNAQSCGKCVPCRDGLEMLENILEDILHNKGTMDSLTLLKQTAEYIKLTADCAIGAHAGKKLNLQGEDCTNVISAVEMLRAIGDGDYPDYTGKRVIVIGGGQPIHDGMELAGERAQNLYSLDRKNSLRFSHENPAIIAAYEDYFEKPLSHKAHALLHTDHDAWKMPGER